MCHQHRGHAERGSRSRYAGGRKKRCYQIRNQVVLGYDNESGSLQHGKGGMPFIQVADFWLNAQRTQSRIPPHSAHGYQSFRCLVMGVLNLTVCAAKLCSDTRTSSTTVAQSPLGGWRKRRIVPGYQGESFLLVSQRQSVLKSGNRTQHNLPIAPARWAMAVSTQIIRSRFTTIAAESAKSKICGPRFTNGRPI